MGKAYCGTAIRSLGRPGGTGLGRRNPSAAMDGLRREIRVLHHKLFRPTGPKASSILPDANQGRRNPRLNLRINTALITTRDTTRGKPR